MKHTCFTVFRFQVFYVNLCLMTSNRRMELLTNKLGSNGCTNGCSSKYADDNKDKVLADRLERLRAERSSGWSILLVYRKMKLETINGMI